MKKEIRCTLRGVLLAGTAALALSGMLANAQSPSAARARANELVKQMTLDEKLQMIVSKYPMATSPGGSAGYIQGVERLKIPDLNLVDSSTGSGATLLPSAVFPATVGVAASWNEKLAEEYGVEVARQLRAEGFGMGLGGGTNLAREPRGGRLFEYLGEDPLLAGKMIAARSRGTQSMHVIATIKHYVGNEQELNRFGGNSTIDERTLRELYLMPFEIGIAEGHPGNVMCSYNRINGEYACESHHTLSDVLKGEWAFDGQVQSDWGATHSTVKAINNGLDEEEVADVFTNFFTALPVQHALATKQISEERLNDMVARKLVAMIESGYMDDPVLKPTTPDFATAAKFAQKAAEQSIVLLKNDGAVLPLVAARLKTIAVIGAHADVAVLRGGGSGDVRKPHTGTFAGCGGMAHNGHADCGWWPNPWLKIETPITKAIADLAPQAKVSFAGNQDETESFRAYSKDEIAAAVELAKKSDVAIVFAAQPAGEDFGDLASLSLANPSNQNQLIEAVAAANKHTIVVLETGNPVVMPWRDKVAGIVEAWFPGEQGGVAIANVLFGKVNPSAKLPMSFPAKDSDTPTWKSSGAFDPNPVYDEKLEIGYRWYDAEKIKPAFEFGYGLSYTSFSYSDLKTNVEADHSITVTFTVKNSGAVEGTEIPQVYLSLPDSKEPPQRLVGWSRITLKPGESQSVTIKVSERLQSTWDTNNNRWLFVPGGKISVGASSRDVRLTAAK